MSMDEQNQMTTLYDAAIQGRLSRRTVMKRAVALGLSASVTATLLAACGSDDEEADTGTTPESSTGSAATTPESTTGDATPEATEGDAEPTTDDAGGESTGEPAGEGVPGGTLRIAMIGEPATLDIHQTTGTIVSLVGWNMYEPLIAFDSNFEAIPMLAESIETSEDGLTNTITLRQGVPFHNGEEMMAADVIASIERWGQLSGVGKGLMERTEEITEVDDYTIEFAMSEPYGIFVTALAFNNQGCAIYPKSVIDKVGLDPLNDEFIGTGPYRFVERQADAFIRFERFEDYAALEGEPNGYGGHKYAYADMIELVPVPDEAARVAGLQSGDFHYPESISPDQFTVLQEDPNLVAKTLDPASFGVFIINMQEGLMTDQKIRDAFQAALDHEAICQGAYGEGFYNLDPSLMFPQTPWYSQVGAERFNMNDPELARQLLEEAGYDGTPLRFSCTQEYQQHYNSSVVATQQLEAAGFTVELIVKDWATILSEQTDPSAWDVTTTGYSFKPDPALSVLTDVCNFAGWWCTDDVVELVNQLRTETDFDTRFALWEEIQGLFYTQVPTIKHGDILRTMIHSASMKGLSDQVQLGPILWNVWIEE